MKLLHKSLASLILVLVAATPVSAATLSLSPSSGTYNKSCNFSLEIKLDTQGVQTDGTDAILMYDNTRLTATSITSGNIYADYPGNNIDDTKGVVTTSGLASISSPFSGIGTLATINFTVKEAAATGATQVTFDFNPNDKTKTTDSNVVQRGGSAAEVLSAVTNGSYTIGTGACGTTTPVVTTLPRTGQGQVATPVAQPKNLDQAVGGQTGTAELTFTIAIVGSVLTVLGILGLALL